MPLDTFGSALLGRNGAVSRLLRLFISILFYAQSLLRRTFWRFVGRQAPPTCIVLYYHSVPSRYRAAFIRQLEMLSRLTRPVNAADAITLLPGLRYAAVTFDDGFEDAIENTVPELVKRNIPAVFFVTADFLGTLASWWPESTDERNRRIASVAQLRAIPRKLIRIGAHTLTHPHLSDLDEADAKREIAESRRHLELLLGYGVETFSFPYGDFNSKLVSWCQQAGYKRVFTSQHTWAFQSPDELVVGRVKAEPTDWDLEFRLKLLGGYLWMPWASTVKQKILARLRLAHLRFFGVLSSRRSTAAS